MALNERDAPLPSLDKLDLVRPHARLGQLGGGELEGIRKRIKEWLDNRQHQIEHQLAHVDQDVQHLHVLNGSIAERYLRGDLCLYLRFFLDEVAGHRPDFFAVVHEPVQEVPTEDFTVQADVAPMGASAESGDIECMVLVDVGQFVKVPQGMNLVLVRSELVRLQRCDTIECEQGDAGKATSADALVEEVFLRGADWELRHLGGWEPVATDQFLCDVVEGRAEVVENVTDDYCEMERWLSGDVNHEEAVAVVRIALGSDFVRATAQVLRDFGVKGIKVNICSSDLLDDASKRVSRHA